MYTNAIFGNGFHPASRWLCALCVADTLHFVKYSSQDASEADNRNL